MTAFPRAIGPRLMTARQGRVAVAPLLVAGLWIAAAWPVLLDMHARWFDPAQPAYRHGPLALALAIGWGVRTWRQREPATAGGRARIVGSAFALLGVLVFAAGRQGEVTLLAAMGLLLAAAGLTLATAGWRVVRTMTPTLLLGVCAVPLPTVYLAMASRWLQEVAAVMAAALARPAVDGLWRTGLELTCIARGEVVTLTVSEGCSGLSGLMTLLWVGVAAAVCGPTRGVWRWTVVIAAVPVALLVNAGRIAALAVIASRWGVDEVAPTSAVHQLVGLIAIGSGIGLLLLVARLAGRGGASTEPPRAPGRHAGPAWPWAAVAAAMLALTLLLPTPTPVAEPASRDWSALPAELQLEGQRWTATDLPLTDETPRRFPGGSLHRRYDDPAGRSVELVVTDAGPRRESLYDPATCLASSGHRVIAAGAADAAPVATAALSTERHGQRFAHRLTFAADARFYQTYTRQQAAVLLARVLGRPVDAVTVRLTVQAGLSGDAEALADAAMRDLLPHVQARLAPRDQFHPARPLQRP